MVDSSEDNFEDSDATAESIMQSPSGRNWISLRKFAILIEHSYPTVLRWVKADPPKLQAVRIGGRWRVYEDEVKRFLEYGNRDE